MELEKQYLEEDEITLKELILKVQEYFWEVVRNWKWVVLITIPFILLFLYQAISTPVTYHSELTFMVNEDDGGGIGGVSAILGQFGFAGGGKGKNNLDKILELAKSRIIVQQVIFDSISVNGRTDYLGNHVIRLYKFHEKWADDTTGLKEFTFVDSDLSTRQEKRALKSVYSKIIGGEKVKGIFSSKYSKDTGIMQFNAKTVSEELSIELCNILYEYLSSFYVSRTVEKQQQTFDVMLQKVDSVKKIMSSAEYQLADFLDQNRGLYTAKAKRRELELQRDVRLFNEMYAVTLKNFEIADFSLKNKTPFIQLIDEPISPLEPKGESIIKNLIIGSFLGGFIAIFFVLSRKIYNDTMKSDAVE
jgi:hypothetical protein